MWKEPTIKVADVVLQTLKATAGPGGIAYFLCLRGGGQRELALCVSLQRSWKQLRDEDDESHHRYHEVVSANVAEADQYLSVARANHRDVSVFDPDCITIPGWRRADYLDLATSILIRNVTRIVSAPGWAFDARSRHLAREALDRGTPFFDVSGLPIGPAAVDDQVACAISEIRVKGQEAAWTESDVDDYVHLA